MSATITALLTTWNTAESATGWTAGAVDTDNFIQGASSIGLKVSAATTAYMYNNGSTVNLSNTHIYIWMECSTAGLLDTFANGGIRIRVAGATATNYGEWYVAGKDTYGGGFKCFVIDTAKAFSATGGTPPALTAIQHVGGVFKMIGTLMGNFNNTHIDVIRYGTGLKITAGTIGTPGTFDDIVSDDNSTTNAYGIIKRSGGVIFLQGELQFGDTSSGTTIFADTDEIIVFDSPALGTTSSAVSNTLYKITVQGNSGGDIRFSLGTKQGSGDTSIGTNGCIFTSPSVRYQIKFDDPDIDILNIYGCQFKHANTIDIGHLSAGSLTGSVEFVDNTFNDCDQITRNVSASAGHLFLKNSIIADINTIASFQVADTLNVDGSRFRVIKSDAFTSQNNSTIETVSVKNHDFSTNTSSDKWIHVFAKKTWKVVNPVGTITTGDQNTFKFAANDSNSVEELYSLNLTVTTPAGVAIASASSYVYEGLTNKDLPSVNRQITDTNGFATSDILKRQFTDNAGSSLTVASRGNFALRVYKYVKSPFIGSLTVSAVINQGVTLTTDTAVIQQNQATAITAGSSITITEHTVQPLKIINYDNGTAAFADSNVVVGQTTGAQGTIREIIGDTTSGTIVLHTWNGIAFSNNENLQVGGSTKALANTSGVGSFDQNYRWEVNCNSLSLTTVYDYLAARMAEIPITSPFDTVIIWGEAEQSQLIYSTANGYITERNVSLTRGVWLSKKGSGTVSYMTSNSGTQYIPPVQYSFTLTGLQSDSEVRIYKILDNSQLSGTESSGTSFTYNYTYGGDISVYVVIFHISYKEVRLINLTLTNANQSIPIQQQTDRVYLNP